MNDAAIRIKEKIKSLAILLFPNTTALYIFRNQKAFNSLKVWGGDSLSEMIEENINFYLTEEEKENTSLLNSIKKDIIKCHFKYGINPIEYFIHDFRTKTDKIRNTYMPKKLKDQLIMSKLGDNRNQAFIELKDKFLFYKLAKQYFKRDVCNINGSDDFYQFELFTQKHTRFIAKPINGRFGQNTNIYDLKEYNYSPRAVFNILLNITNEWIIEELIVQDDRMSEWNSSSVNTIRIPSFRTAKGIVVFAPFMRTGRKDSPVDNGGAGGVMFSLNSKTGETCSDAIDELGHTFKAHPDSNKIVKGWRVPEWDKLLLLSEEVHKSLPLYHKYVGFDFALSKDKGWILVEGNWGDFICQQATLHRGLKKEFTELINL